VAGIKLTLRNVDQITQYKLKLEVSRKFGNDGLKVYNLLEKSTDFEYIKNNAGLEEDRLYRILAYVAKLGLISAEGLPSKYTEESPITEGLVVGVHPAESLVRFRHQKMLFKSFSSVGVKIYEYLRENESTYDRISRDLGIEPERVKEILDFMIANDIAYSKQVGPVKAPTRAKEEAPKEKVAPPVAEEGAFVPHEEEKAARKEKRVVTAEEEEEIAPPAPEEKPTRKEKRIAPAEEEEEIAPTAPEEKPTRKEKRIAPAEEEEEIAPTAPEEKPTRKEKKGVTAEEEEEIAPVTPEEKPTRKEKKGVTAEEEEEIAPVTPEEKPKRKERVAPPKPVVKRLVEEEMPAEVKIDENLEYKIADLPLADKYRIQKEVLDRFGAAGLKVYSLFTVAANVKKVAEFAGIEEDKVKEIAGYLLAKNYLVYAQAPAEEIAPTGEEERREKARIEEEEIAPKEIKEEKIMPEEEISPREKEKRKKVEIEEEIKPTEEEIAPEEEKIMPEEEISPREKEKRKKVEIEEEIKPEEEIAPPRKEKKEKARAKEEEIKPSEEEEITPLEEEEVGPLEEKEKIETEEEVAPKEEKEEITEEKEEIETEEEEVAPKEEITEEEEEKETVPLEEEEIVVPEEEEEKEEIETEEEGTPEEEKEEGIPEEEIEEEEGEKELSQFEKIINESYGEKGLQVYKLIDGKRTAEEIMKEANVDEEFIIDFFSFLENRGIIRLERPGGEKKKEEGEEKAGPESATIQPLTETIKVPKKEIIILDMVPLDVPILNKLNLPARMSLEAKLLAKFGPRSLRLLNKIDNESDIVKLAIENGIDMDEMDEILYAISNSGGCTFATLSEEDINQRYGSEALEVYKKFGRDGIIIYQLIGKMDSIKKMVQFANINPKKAVEIIININELLGIEGVTKKDLYNELGIIE